MGRSTKVPPHRPLSQAAPAGIPSWPSPCQSVQMGTSKEVGHRPVWSEAAAVGALGGREGWEQPGKAPLTRNILCAPLQCQSPTAHPSLWLPCDLAPSWAGGGRARGQGSCQLRGTAIDHLHSVGAGTEEGREPLRQPPNSVCLAGFPGSFPTRAASLLCARCTLAQVWRQPGVPHHVNQVWVL